ncbi:hypothetical protein RBH20_19925 [Haloarcula sp. H-GB4]|uniref:hypothetical protein n=1 Tax=Haloarcula sp. H-GB4 TaxID=3069755 RepID=UPI0027B6E7C6|nr:hypothetical protein [Haloarcula sp. H-GB4]MDQ2074798.1 hypothetical protein [Haloarcula sp. H-GB4]
MSLHLANGGNATHELSVSVVSGELGDESVGLNRIGRDIIHVSPRQGLVTYRFTGAQPDVESIELPQNRVVSQEEFRLTPNESVQTNITDFQTGDTLVIIDRRDGRISTLITANCDDQGLDFVSIIASTDRTSAAYACD